MRKWRRRLALISALGLLAIAALCAYTYFFRGIPQDAASAMRNADSFELLSLDPLDENRGKSEFHGFKVLGRATVTDPSIRKRLYDSLQSGARWSNPMASMCFDPRHAIRVRHNGRTFDLLICFECGQIVVHDGNDVVGSCTVSESPKAIFNQTWRDAGLSIAPN